ncbi:group II intron maturase-specific domain-containing protein [Frankia sp. EAN1pec]|uniref:group II intron maturase-specific domain-containing protein n=1 Tax=Parafrankia sp. (strain EAN1pec) TaxID=298653 RepID=UPI0012F9112D
MNYYGRFYRSALYPLLQRINTYLMRWARRKYRRLRSVSRFKAWWKGLVARAPALFAQWRWTDGILPTGW